MSDTNDQSQKSKTMKIIIFVVGIIILFAIIVVISVVVFKKLYPEGGKGEEEEKAAELMEDSPESSKLNAKREKSSLLRENATKKDMASFAVNENKGNDLSFSGLSNANKLKKSELKDTVNDVKTDLLVNMGNIQ